MKQGHGGDSCDGGRERDTMAENRKYRDIEIDVFCKWCERTTISPTCVSLGDCLESESKLLGEDNCISGAFLPLKVDLFMAG